jgi:hypothetical protein
VISQASLLISQASLYTRSSSIVTRRLAKNKGKVSMFIPVGAAAEVGVGRMLAVPALTVLALMSILREGCSEIFPGFTNHYGLHLTLALHLSLSFFPSQTIALVTGRKMLKRRLETVGVTGRRESWHIEDKELNKSLVCQALVVTMVRYGTEGCRSITL